MGFIDKKKKSGFRSDTGGKKSYSDNDSRGPVNKPSSRATCGACGNSCTVPFRPTAGKPVYCNDCFRKNSSDFSDRGASRYSRDSGPRNREFGSDSRQPTVNLSQINDKLDRILKILES